MWRGELSAHCTGQMGRLLRSKHHTGVQPGRTHPSVSGERIIEVCVPVADARYAHRTLVLDMRGLHNAFDAMVVTAGSNAEHVRRIAEAILARVRAELGVSPASIEGWSGGEWIALDYGSVVVHVMSDEARAYYDLEYLWSMAPVRVSEAWVEPVGVA